MRAHPVRRLFWRYGFGTLAIACATEAPPGIDDWSAPDASLEGAGGHEPGAAGQVAADGGQSPVASGGAPSDGGMASTGGDPSSGGAGDDCAAGAKRCGGLCVPPSPAIGCSLAGCDPCPPPPESSEPFCDGEQCSFMCAEGLVLSMDGMRCEPEAAGAGGTSPGGGSGGMPPGAGGASTCVASQCGNCLLLTPECCFNNGTACGCRGLLGECLAPL